MSALEVLELPLADGNFSTDDSASVVIGDCRCYGRPHEQDTAEVRVEIPWYALIDVGTLSGGAAYRGLVFEALVSWNLLDAEGEPVPITPVTVGRLRPERIEAIAAVVNVAYERAQAPLPNGSGAPSRRSRRESASPNPTIRPRARRTRSR